jgi:hypothetical protein
LSVELVVEINELAVSGSGTIGGETELEIGARTDTTSTAIDRGFGINNAGMKTTANETDFTW